MPAWANHAILWQIYPLGFTSAESEASGRQGIVHRLGHIAAWLDYAVELGASGLLLGPIFASSTHGYDTIDYFTIDPRLGDEADFKALVEAAHSRGLRVILDGVFNHVGRDFPAFRRAIIEGEQAAEASWFHIVWPDKSSDAEPDYATFEGHRQLVSLNHAEPAVADFVARVMNHWLVRGADGWRLDAAYAVPRTFWADVVSRVRVQHPDAYLFGEVIHGDYAGFVRETSVDAVTQYELWKAIWSALNDCNFFELAHALNRHNVLLETFAPLTFIGNHDVTRIASQLIDDRHLPHALAILLMCGGTPSIYSGDEQAFRGLKERRAGGDDAIRPAFPVSPADLAPFGWPVYRLHQQLIGLRRRNPWLYRASTRPVDLAKAHFIFESFNGPNCVRIALNVGDVPVDCPMPDGYGILAGNGVAARQRDARAQIGLVPHGWAILGKRDV
jgi:cyclomaltodextrinase / maltogenic alpha-amylase / neopullulanase